MSIDSIMTAIADKIRSLLGISDKLGLVAMSTNLETANTEVATQEELMGQIIDALKNKSADGGNVENLFKYATNAEYLFNGTTFPNGYELVLNIPVFKETMNRVCRYAKGLKNVKLKGNIDNNTVSLQYAFQQYSNNTMLEEIDFSEWGNGEIKVTYGNNAFSEAIYLHTIRGIFDFTNSVNVNGMLNTCNSLENIAFKSNTLSKSMYLKESKLLSDTSIQSIIDGLATVEKSQTLTFHADVKAKLTETQLATITNKNWTLA